MNLDELFRLEAGNPLVDTSPGLLIGCVLVSVCIGWYCARKYRNTYEILRSIRLYLILALCAAGAFALTGLPLLFVIGAQLCGFVAMLLISNRYF